MQSGFRDPEKDGALMLDARRSQFSILYSRFS